MNAVEIKICGLTRRRDVELAALLGFDYAGFVFAPGSLRRVAPERMAELAAVPGIRRVGVFRDASEAEIRALLDAGLIDIVQLHGDESPEFAARLGQFAPVWKAAHLAVAADVARFAEFPASRLVLDGRTGGGGVRCDWKLAAQMARLRPVMLAGGLAPDNAAAAIMQVRPAGIDLAGGVELEYGIKSEDKMRKLKEALQ